MIHANYAPPPLPQSTPLPRPRPVKPSSGNSRESNALRASILDTALELGIGNNSLVTAWMFDNALQEEEEDEGPFSPTKNAHNASTGPVPTSSVHLYTPPSASSSVGRPTLKATPDRALSPKSPTNDAKLVNGWSFNSTDDAELAHPSPVDSPKSAGIVSFPSSSNTPIPPVPETPGKKSKKKGRGDGNESDGGYMSEGSRKLSKKESKAKLKDQKDGERKRKKSFGLGISSKSNNDSAYETDGGKSPFKSKSKKKDKSGSTDNVGYDTDGYTSAGSKKSKRSFFKLGLKSSRGDLKGEAAQIPAVPPMPTPKEPASLPIAGRFASSLADTLYPTGKPPTSAEDPFVAPPSVSSNPSGPSNSSPGQSAGALPSIAPTQPMTFDNFSAESPTSLASPSFEQPPRHPTLERSSLSSADSSASSSARRLVHFSPSRENSRLQGTEARVISEIDSTRNSNSVSSNGHSGRVSNSQTSSRNSLKSSPQWVSQAISPGQSPKSTRSFSISSNAAPSKASPVTISYPITRTVSPAPAPPPISPIYPLNIVKNTQPHLAPLEIHPSRGPSPTPLAPDSPYVMVFPRGGISSSASYHEPQDTQVPTSVGPSANSIPRSPNPSVNPRSLASPPVTNNGRLSPNPMSGHRPTPLSIGNDHEAPLPSPNVLAYYDIPPPSPPPMGPLPSVPPVLNSPSSQFRAKVLERQMSGADMVLNAPKPSIQRGRESPFPTRPLAAPPPSPFPNGGGVPGLEARTRIPARYNVFPMDESFVRPMEVAKSPGEQWDHRQVVIIPPRQVSAASTSSFSQPPPSPQEDRKSDHDVEDRERDNEYDDYSDDEAFRDVLNRLTDPSNDGQSEESASNDHSAALPARRSFEALRERRDSFAVDDYYTDRARDTTYTWDDGATTNGGARESRWSGSIYSRVSILDADTSETTRDRLVRRVEAMLAKKESEVVPPVPKIPEGLVNATSHWNKF